MAMERVTGGVCWCFFIFGLLQLYGAQVNACTVTQDGDQTKYSVLDLPHISDVKASGCEYTWSNESRRVIAHNNDKTPELVMVNSIDTLVTSKCLEGVIYTRSCLSERNVYNITCMISCTASAQIQTEKDKDSTPSWIVALGGVGGVVGVVVGVVGVILLVLVLGLLYKFRNKILSCSQLGCIYTLVKTEASGAANVEMRDV